MARPTLISKTKIIEGDAYVVGRPHSHQYSREWYEGRIDATVSLQMYEVVSKIDKVLCNDRESIMDANVHSSANMRRRVREDLEPFLTEIGLLIIDEKQRSNQLKGKEWDWEVVQTNTNYL